MRREANINAGGGITFCGMLTIVFIVLRLVGVIDWAWWLVLIPIWAPTALALLVLLGFWITHKVALAKWNRERKRNRKKRSGL